MDLKRLGTFVAVAEEQGFARAANRLGLAQPAVSKHIRDLEDEIDGLLFERCSDGIRLTHAGEVMLERARCLLFAAEAMGEYVRRAARGETGTLTIAYNETVSWGGIIPQTVYAFRSACPEVRLTMLPMNSLDQMAALREKRIDAGFLFFRDPDEDIVGAPVLVDPLRLAVPAGSHWVRQPPAKLAELAAEPFIWIPRGASPVYYDSVLALCREAGLRLRIIQEAANESAALSLVAVGMGLTFVPASAERRRPDDVVLLPVSDLTMRVTLDLAWRRSHEDDLPLRRFLTVAGVKAPQV